MAAWVILTTQDMPATRINGLTRRFDFHAKRVFLTYPRCDLEKEEALRLLVGVLGDREFHYIIGREKHGQEAADGEPEHHLHVYLEFSRPLRVRDERYFDLGDCHPNIQAVRRPMDCQQYCIKDGDYIANMAIGTIKRTYGEIISGSASKEDFLVAIEESYPRDLVLNFERITKFAESRFSTNTMPAYTTEVTGFVVPELLEDWYDKWVKDFEPDGMYH